MLNNSKSQQHYIAEFSMDTKDPARLYIAPMCTLV